MSSGEEENVEGIENPPIDESDPVFRSVAEADVSLDEMMSLACRQGKLDIVELLLESGAHVDYRNKAGNTPLLEACSQGHVDVAKYLLDHDANIDAPTETTSDSALTWACTLGNEAIVSLLLERKANVEHRTKDGCTALMFAALAGHVKVAAMLLDHSAEINVESDSNKDSPLTFACWKGHCDVVELLLLRNANIEHRTKEGFTPLMFAALGGHTDVAAKLLEQGAKVNVPSGSNNDIPLTSACWKGHHDVVKLLLEYHSNIEHRTKDGCTPLMLAAREGHYSVAKLILDSRAEVNKPSGSENNIPLTLACWKGHTTVVELLLDHKSNIEHRNKAGCTPLMLAAREGHVETTQLLLSRGAEINKPSGSNDDTPLTLACWKGHGGVVELLLKHSSKVDHQTKTGCTPLMEATREGHVAVAKLLLEHNADVELPDNYGQSPLFMACWKGHGDVAELLLEHNANRDCRTKTGITPLFQACRENHVNVVKLLLDYGASVNATFPNSRENPLTLACEKGHAELVSLLLRRNANLECHTKKGCTPFHLSCKEGHLAIAIALHVRGADTEAPDYRNNAPLISTMKNGHVEALEWLLNVVDHLPSEEQCQKCLVAPIDDKERHDELMLGRTKCYDLILKCKKAKEQKVQRNTELLLKELENEKERENNRKKKAAAKRRDKRRRRKAAKESEQAKELKEETPLENRPQEVAEPPDSDAESSDIEDEEEGQNKPKENHKIENALPKADKINGQQDCDGKKEDSSKYVECSRGRGKLVMEEEPSKSLVGSNDRQHQQNQDSPNDFEERKSSSQNSKAKNTRKKSEEINHLSKDIKNCLKEGNGSTTDISSSSRDVITSSKDDKKKVLPNSKGNKKDDKENDSKAKTMNIGMNCVRNDPKHEKSKRDNTSQRHNSSGSTVNSASTKCGTDMLNITTNTTTLDRIDEHSAGHPVSPRDRNKPHPSPKSSPESDTEKSLKRRSRDVAELEGSCSGDHVKYKTASRGSTTSAQSTTAAKTTTNESEKEQKPLQSPRSKQHTQQPLKEDSWKEVTRATNSKTMVVQLTAPNALCGRVIGRGGSKINSITEESGAQITIGKPEPKAPTDRVITIKGSTKSVQRAKFLVSQALNTPSTSAQTSTATPSFTTMATLSNHTNTSTVSLRGNFPALTSSSSEWPTIAQANTMATTTVAKVVVAKAPDEVPSEIPVEIVPEKCQTHSRSPSTGSSESGHSNKSDPAKPSIVASKASVMAWANQAAWKPNRPCVTQSIGVSTSAITTCVSSHHVFSNGLADNTYVSVANSTSNGATLATAKGGMSQDDTATKQPHNYSSVKDVVTTVAAITRAETTTTPREVVEPSRPVDTVANTTSFGSMWPKQIAEQNCEGTIKGPFGAIGDIPCNNSVFQDTSQSFPSRRKEPLISEPIMCTSTTGTLQSTPSARATKFYSPWSTQPTGITDIGRDNTFSASSDKYEGRLPGMELFAGSNSLFSGTISSYPWSSGEDADQSDRSHSVSWSGQANYDDNARSHQQAPGQKCETTHPLTTELHGDQRPLGKAWSWGQTTGKSTVPSALSVVCDEDPPDKQAWNNSDSTSSSQSSSRQELSSIMDNEGTATSSGVWCSSSFDENNLTPTPHTGHSSSLPQPDPNNHPTSQWSSNRGAFSAPSSPSLPRSHSQPEPTSNLSSRPSVDDSSVRSWNKHKSPRSQSSSEQPSGWDQNTQGARRSSVDMTQSFPSELINSPWQYSSRSQEVFVNQHKYNSREPWADSQFASSSVDLASVLKRLTLEKYLPVFQENNVTGSRLAQMNENDLENLGIPKGPRLKLLHAIHGNRSTTWPTINNSYPNAAGNGFMNNDHQSAITPQPSKTKSTSSIIENHNHVHANTEPGMTPLAIKKALQKQDYDNHPQAPIPNHGNQPLLSLMSPHSQANHNEYAAPIPPRPHSASGNLSSSQVFNTNTTTHVDHFPYGAPQGPYVNHVTTYNQQVYYPAGGYYYYYPQQ